MRPNRVRTRAPSAAGFTMVELLVAILLMSLLLVMVMGLFYFLQDTSESIDRGRRRDRAARIVLDRLEQELTGAILIRRHEGEDPLAHPWLFYGVDSSIDGDDADQIRFVTQTPLRAPGERFGRGVRLVTYGLEPDADGGRVLLRREEPLPDQLEKFIDLTEAQVVARDVQSFDLAYSGGASEWDSTSIEQSDSLPDQVEIRISLLERVPGEAPLVGDLVARVVDLPTRPEYFEPPTQLGDSACETGPSPAQCREPWLAIIEQEAGADAADSIAELFDTVPDACWDDPDSEPSAALADLQLQIEALSFNAEAPECPLPSL